MPIDSPNPFRDNEKEPNPFADDPTEDAIPTDPYAPPQSDEIGYNPNVAGHYETTSPGRGGTLMTLAMSGLVISVAGLVPFMCCLPVNVLGLAFSLPAWIMANADLKAIELGAIDASARDSTRRARTLGIVGTLLGLILPPALLAGLLLLDTGTQAMKSFFEWLGF